MFRIAILTTLIAIPMIAQTTVIQPSSPNFVTETRTFALKNGGRLIIKSNSGYIRISAWDRDEVALTANFRPSSRNRAHSKIEVKSNTNSLELTVEHPKEINEIGYCQLELKVPNRIACNIKTGSPIAINGITGKINAETRHGDIVLENVSGNINASTRYGNVSGSIQNIEDNLDISTRYGNIKFKLPNPNGSFTASTRYGNIRIPSGARDVKVSKSGQSTIRARYDGAANMRFVTRYGSISFQ